MVRDQSGFLIGFPGGGNGPCFRGKVFHYLRYILFSARSTFTGCLQVHDFGGIVPHAEAPLGVGAEFVRAVVFSDPKVLSFTVRCEYGLDVFFVRG